MRTLALIFLALLSAMTIADHERGFYAGANAAITSSESLANNDDINRDKVELPTLELLAGYKYNGWLGVDLRYGQSMSNRDYATNSGAINRIEYSIDGYQSLYYRPEITNREAKLYFLIGYTELDVESESFDSNDNSTGNNTFSESGTSYGLGAGWFINKNVNFNVEYRELLDNDEDEFGIVSLGADFRF